MLFDVNRGLKDQVYFLSLATFSKSSRPLLAFGAFNFFAYPLNFFDQAPTPFLPKIKVPFQDQRNLFACDTSYFSMRALFYSFASPLFIYQEKTPSNPSKTTYTPTYKDKSTRSRSGTLFNWIPQNHDNHTHTIKPPPLLYNTL